MAHIKVERRSMRPEEWTSLRFGWLKRHIYRESFEIAPLWIRDARQVRKMEYEYYSADYRPLERGDLYFTPDGTAFIKGECRIPQELRRKKLWLRLKTAAEIIVKVNGIYVGGIDPNRERVLLSPYIGDAEVLRFEMQGYNRSKPDDERNPESLSVRGCRQIFEGAYLAVVDEEVQSLVYDLELLLDIAGSELFNEDYRQFLNRQLNEALNLVDFDTMEGVRDASQYIETYIYGNTDYKGSGDVALVGHSHLDIAYYWRRIHSVQKNLRTVLIQLRLMERYPEFRYAHTQAYTYELLEKYYPEVFDELRQKVADGQFEIAGAMYVEPDCNVPGCESLIRQCLYGQRYYREKFGKTVNNCWLPDVFGNSWILPQILKKSGVDYFVSNKMSTWNDTNRFPHNNFIWRGIDGTQVYACVPPTHFITWSMPSQIQENWEAYQDKNTGGQTLCMFGYGDGGSGCTEEMLELMRRFEKLSVMPKTEQISGAEFLEKNLKGNESLAVWDGELYLEMHRGTFTTKADLKKHNRRLEFKFRETELRCALKSMRGEEYPAERIRGAYKKFLVNQFHDILPGSHIHPVYDDAMDDYAAVEAELDVLLDARGGQYFNSLNFPRETLTFIEDETGGNARNGKRGYWTVPNLPALSCGSLRNETGTDTSWLTVGDTVETPFYSIIFDAHGSITGLYDKELEREWVDGALNRLRIFYDYPGMYDAWDILPSYREKELELTVKEALRLTHADSESAEFSVILATENSVWEQIIRVFRTFRGIEAENHVDWNEKHKLAKAEFGCNVLSRELCCDTGAGIIRRETHRNTSWQAARYEVCHHKWFDFSETGGGIAVINDGKYGVGAQSNLISLSLLRATVRPDITSDLGRHDFCYMILPHASDAVTAGINRVAYEYNISLLRSGPLDVPFESFDGLFLQSVKRGEDGKLLVLRLVEQDGKRGRIRLKQKVKLLNLLEDNEGETDLLDYQPFEIITIGLQL